MRGVTALLVRSLRQDSRHLMSHLLRGGVVALCLTVVYSVVSSGLTRIAPGRSVFMAIVYTNYACLVVTAIGYFATSVTEEKEEQTLALLRMAGISPLSLLLGKAASRLWLALLLLCCQFPFTLLAITLGGVTLHQIGAAGVALLSYTVLLSGLATLTSVVSARSVSAVILTATGVVLLMLLNPITAAIDDLAADYLSAAMAVAVEFVTDNARYLSMSSRLTAISSVSYGEDIVDRHAITCTVVGIGLYGLSWLLFDLFAYRQQDTSPSRVAHRIRRLPGLRPGRTWAAAVVWKDFHFLAGGVPGWIFKVVLMLAATTAIAVPVLYRDRTAGIADFGRIMMMIALLFGFAELSLQSTRLLSDEIVHRGLTLLAMLPQSVAATMTGKTIGSLLGLVPHVSLLLLGLLLDPTALAEFLRGAGNAENLFSSTFSLSLLAVFLHLNVFFSTFIRWGAIPVSFGILMAFNVCCFSMVQPGGRGPLAVLFFVLTGLGVGACLVLQVLTAHRFRELAGQES